MNEADRDNKLKFIISLSVLEDLGINLYGSLPEVLAEAVANSWDADATKVSIDIRDEKIIICDDGVGMTRQELQDFYLTVGHKRREQGRTKTPKGRKPMGRKGIGKLSLFSIADIVTVETVKNDEKTTIKIDVNKIREEMRNPTGENEHYLDEEIDPSSKNFTKGTKITLTEIKRQRIRIKNLNRNLARRFFMIGQEQGFDIKINGESLSIEDRGYSKLVEYLWVLSPHSDSNFDNLGELVAHITEIESNAEKKQKIEIEEGKPDVRGWVGTARDSGALSEEDANGIVLMVRGKMAHPDISPYLDVRELASKYIFGEIHADFLDHDEHDDIATTDRQRFKEDDPRFKNLISFIKENIIRRVINDRAKFKEESAEKDATTLLPPLKKWLDELKGDHKTSARKILASINKTLLPDSEKREYYKKAVIAHQYYAAWGRLGRLDELSESEEHINEILSIFESLDSYEAASYYEIAKGRIKILRKLENITREENVIESVVRDYLKEHLWLLDPSWDRATEPAETEKTVKRYLNTVGKNLSKEQRGARFDIVYRRSSGKHTIIELKRYDRKVSVGELVDQVRKYKEALLKGLVSIDSGNRDLDIVCLVGPNQDFLTSSDARKSANESLRPSNARIMTYDEMIDQTLKMYKDFIEAEEENNKLIKFLEELSTWSPPSNN